MSPLVVLIFAVACAALSFRLLVVASESDHTPPATYAACIIGMFLSVTAVSVALLTLLRLAAR